MALRGTKVGQARVDVDYNVDTANALREMAAFQASASRLADIKADLDTSRIMAKRAEMAAIGDNLAREFTQPMQERVRRMHDQIAADTANNQRLNAAYAQAGDQAARSFTRDMDNHFKQAVMAGLGPRINVDNISRDMDNVRRRIDIDVHRGSAGWASIIGQNLFGGISGILSLLPARLESIFTNSGPVLGSLFAAGFGAALAVAAPVAGAGLVGGIAGVIGLGGIAAAIALNLDHPELKQKAKDLGEHIVGHLKESAHQVLPPMLDALDQINQKVDSWKPHFDRFFHGIAAIIPDLTKGFIGFLDEVVPAIARFTDSSFFKDMNKIFSESLPKIGAAIKDFFDRILANPDAMDGLKKGFEDFLNLIPSAIRLLSDIIIKLAEFWSWLNNDPDAGGPAKSRMQMLRDEWQKFRETIEPIVGILEKIVGLAKPPSGGNAPTVNPMGGTKDDPNKRGAGSPAMNAGDEFKTRLMDNIPDEATGLNAFVKPFAALEIAIGLAKAAWGTFQTWWTNSAWPQLKETFSEGLRRIRVEWDSTWQGLRSIVDPAWMAIKVGWGIFWETLKSVGNTAMEAIKSAWNSGWGSVKAGAEGIWLALTLGWQIFWESLKSVGNTAIETVKGAWNAGWGFVKSTFDSIILAITLGWQMFWEIIKGIFTGAMEFVKGAWNAGWGWIKDTFSNIVFAITLGWQLFWEIIKGIFNGAMEFVKAAWNAGWGWIKDTFSNIVFAITLGWQLFWEIMKGILNGAIEFVKGTWNAGWGWVKDTFSNIVFAITLGWQLFWEIMKGILNGAIEFVKSTWNAGWEAVRLAAENAWNTLTNAWNVFWQTMQGLFNTGMGILRSGWDSAWEGIKNTLGGIWDQIVQRVRDGINNVLDILDKGINLINGVLDKLGISFRVPNIGRLAGGGPVSGLGGGVNANAREGRAGGGRIHGPGSETQDKVPIMASPNEFMIKAKSARKLGYRNLAFMNKWGQYPANRRYAAGGRVGGNNNALLDAHRDHVHVAMNVAPMGFPQIIAKAATSGLPFNVGSTYRPGSRGSGGGLDHHSTGRAVDFPGFNQDAFASFWEKTAGVIELIHRSGARDYAIFGGGGGGFLNEFFAKGIGWIMDHMLNPVINKLIESIPGGHPYGEIAKAVVGKLRDELKKKIEDAIAAAAAVDTGGGGAAGAQKWAGTAQAALNMLGLPGTWLGPLLTLIGRESGGNPNAVNRTDSNAMIGTPSMGLMQTIGPTFNAYKLPGHDNILDPLSNILAGLRYIIARYGSIFNVQQAVGSSPRGYKNGGLTQAGWNFMHEPELALNSAQGRALEDRIRGDGFSIKELHIHVNGSVSQAEAKRIAAQVRDELIKLSRRNGGKTGLPGS